MRLRRGGLSTDARAWEAVLGIWFGKRYQEGRGEEVEAGIRIMLLLNLHFELSD